VLIAIDASTLSTQGGPRTYLQGLLRALLEIDRENRYLIFYNDPVHLGSFPKAREMVLPGKNAISRLFREHILLPLACRREKVDLLHCPKSAIPFRAPCPVVVTLHDLIPVMHPELETFAARCYWKMHIPAAARRSDFIITISEHALQEIRNSYDVPADRIRVVMQSFDPAMLDRPDPEKAKAVRNKYGLGDGYILYVGTIQPRKNLETLIKAFALLKRNDITGRKLVIVGRKGWMFDSLFSRISELGLENDVLFTGFIPDEELPDLFDGAAVFAYLSLFEGFGRPPLEAMACGVPVVTSNTTAIPEVVGNAGIAVDPRDPVRIAEALRQVLETPVLAEELRKKGIERARIFSWEKTARETMEIYGNVKSMQKRRTR
jgi:glycosyltransferase involved in cell wall biosynthesis